MITLDRFPAETSPDGVFGVYNVNGYLLFTCEDDWDSNKPNLSCVPAGTYRLKRVNSPKFGPTYEIVGVPGRGNILASHPGNTEENSEGCVLTGLSLGCVVVPKDEDTGEPNRRKLAVLQSRQAHQMFLERMRSVEEDVIQIRWIGN